MSNYLLTRFLKVIKSRIVNAEIELLELLIKTCKAVRNPQRPGARTEMAIPAAQWEMRFEERKAELTEQGKKMRRAA